MKFPKRYTLTPYDAARQQILLEDPHLAEPVPPLLTFEDPLPGAERRQGVLREHGVVIWRCEHRHRSDEGALVCAWRERGVRTVTLEDDENARGTPRLAPAAAGQRRRRR